MKKKRDVIYLIYCSGFSSEQSWHSHNLPGVYQRQAEAKQAIKKHKQNTVKLVSIEYFVKKFVSVG